MGLAVLSPFRAPGTLGTGGTQSFQAPRYPETLPRWPETLRTGGAQFLLGPKLSWGLGRLSPFRTPGTPATGGTQFLQPPKYSGDWRDSVISAPRYPWDCWDPVISGSQIPLGLAGLSPFRLPATLAGTGGTQSFQAPRYPCWDWRDSVISAPKLPWGRSPPEELVLASHLSPED